MKLRNCNSICICMTRGEEEGGGGVLDSLDCAADMCIKSADTHLHERKRKLVFAETL